MYVQLYMVAYPRRLAIESSRLDLRVHRDSTGALPDGRLMEHGDDLLYQGCRFRLKDRRRRYECADLESRLAVTVVSTVRLPSC